jgi:hypothetical protein
MLFGETVAVYCENRTEHTNTLCGQNAEFLCVKARGTYSNHWTLKGQHFSYHKSFVRNVNWRWTLPVQAHFQLRSIHTKALNVWLSGDRMSIQKYSSGNLQANGSVHLLYMKWRSAMLSQLTAMRRPVVWARAVWVGTYEVLLSPSSETPRKRW